MSEFSIEEYSFQQFIEVESEKDKVEEYKIRDLTDKIEKDPSRHQKIIKAERTAATKSNFEFSEIVKTHRGLKKQAEEEFKNKVENEVQQKLNIAKKEAVDEGIQLGKEEGKGQAYSEFKVKTDEFADYLAQIIERVQGTEQQIIEHQKKNVYELIRGLVKWVILRELKDDGKYLDRLLEKLIYEMNTRSNIIVQVNETTFEQMGEVLESVQKKLGQLKNVRVEIMPELENDAIVLETENGILDSSMTEQFASLDKIFDDLDLENG